jgi:hypothetical protein
MKKAITSQMFIWILVLVFTAFIAIFGFRFVANILNGQEKYASVDLFTDLRDETYGLAYGETKTIKMNLASNFEKICFFDSNPLSEDLNQDIDEHSKLLIYDLTDNGDNLVFFFKKKLPDVYRIENIKLNEDILCFQEDIEASLEGIGEGNTIIIKQ